ncbi:hypothetical protein BDD12DRAFT_814675 [Trichophaea hybrida]|nr:hypothetical protein BDD12DRAFT_814675 [Trichophaea hybrida]
MLAACTYTVQKKKTRKKVYKRILEHLETEGYPGEDDPDFKEANVNDLVRCIINQILFDFRRKTGRNILLRREKQIISVDSKTGGYEAFVMIDWISGNENHFIVVIEVKRSSIGEAMKQCLLAMKDMRNNNKEGKVYGLITTGDDWRMLRYDGSKFLMTDKFMVLFDTMRDRKEKWMTENSILVDYIYAALSNGGIV